MLKLVVQLDCNECGCAFSSAFVSTDPKDDSWKTDASQLRASAENQGWGIFQDCYSICPGCLNRQQLEDDWLQAQEEYEQA